MSGLPELAALGKTGDKILDVRHSFRVIETCKQFMGIKLRYVVQAPHIGKHLGIERRAEASIRKASTVS